jgi:hypothetical protein
VQLAPTLDGGRQYALAPSLSALKPFFDGGQLAVQLNVGPLVQPTTLAQYKARSVPLPPKLFSHNDQQSVWQRRRRRRGARLGRRHGRPGAGVQRPLAVHLHVGDGQRGVPGRARRRVLPDRRQRRRGHQRRGRRAAVRLARLPRGPAYADHAGAPQVLENEYNRITARSIDAQKVLAGALAGTPNFDALLPDKDAASGQKRASTASSRWSRA